MGIVMMLLLYIDVMIYQLIAWMYNLIVSASILEILTKDEILDFTGRIYSFIGILVIFFVSYKIIRFIVNPDDAGAKGKGIGSITSKVFIAILLTVLIPWGFEWGFKLQNAVLSDDIIGRIIYKNNTTSTFSELGTETRTGASYEKVVKYNCGYYGIEKLRPFACAVDIKNYGQQKLSSLLSGFADLLTNSDVIKAQEGLIKNTQMNDGQRFAKLIWSGFIIVRDDQDINQNDVTNYVMDDRFNLTDIPYFIMQPTDLIDIVAVIKSLFGTIWYLPLIPTIAGGWCLFALGKLFFDIVMRLIKLTMLQLTAPFFTAAYVLDDSGKIFGNWLKRVGSLYMMIFIRIFVLQVAMYLIATISKSLMDPGKSISDFSAIIQNVNPLEGIIGLLIIRMTLIFGLLFFATKADKFFGELFPGLQNKDELNAKGAWDFMKKGIGTVVGLGAAVATAGAAAPAIGAAMGIGAAGTGATVAGGLKAAAAGANAVGAAFKGGKSAGGISGISAGLSAGKDALEKSAGAPTLKKQFENARGAYDPEKAKIKVETAKAWEADEKMRQSVFYDSKQPTAIARKGAHAFAGMSSQQQQAIMADGDIKNMISRLKASAADEQVANQMGAAARGTEEFTKAVEAAKKKMSDAEIINTDKFTAEFKAKVTSNQKTLDTSRKEIIQTNASINQFTSSIVEQQKIMNNPQSSAEAQQSASNAINNFNKKIAGLSATLVESENKKHQAETQLDAWGMPTSNPNVNNNQNQGGVNNP